ncbi:hypothetical protein D3C78_17870 [compost metagenome]
MAHLEPEYQSYEGVVPVVSYFGDRLPTPDTIDISIKPNNALKVSVGDGISFHLDERDVPFVEALRHGLIIQHKNSKYSHFCHNKSPEIITKYQRSVAGTLNQQIGSFSTAPLNKSNVIWATAEATHQGCYTIYVDQMSLNKNTYNIENVFVAESNHEMFLVIKLQDFDKVIGLNSLSLLYLPSAIEIELQMPKGLHFIKADPQIKQQLFKAAAAVVTRSLHSPLHGL